MNGYNFTQQVRNALGMAREEAVGRHHDYVGTEHILLGLIRHDDGAAAAVLQELAVGTEEIRQEIQKIVKEGTPARTTGPDLPYTSRAKKVLELAMSEAREMNHDYVGAEHLLLGLVHEEQGIAAQALRAKGVTLDRARDATRRVLDVPEATAENTSALLRDMRASRPAPRISVIIEVHEPDGRLRHRVSFERTREAIGFLEAVRAARGE